MATLLVALLFFGAHLPYLATSLDDIDAVNFALGVRQFDVARHQPHPPGYPVYILLGRLSTGALAWWVPAGGGGGAWDPAAVALAFWSALFGAIGVFAWAALFRRFDAMAEPDDGPRASAGPRERFFGLPIAAVIAATCPLYWFTASRPMSDVPGLAVATCAQALLVAGWSEQLRPGRRVRAGRLVLAGGVVAALAIGIRSQAAWLTLPLFAWVAVAGARQSGWKSFAASVAGCAATGAAWGIPLIVTTGGWDRYMTALGSQGGEDFAGVDMLWTHLTLDRLLLGVNHTFVRPWGWLPLALFANLLAAAGLWILWRKSRRAVLVIALVFGPYAVFHTLFHETMTTRYALPILPAVAYLAVVGAQALPLRWCRITAASIVAMSLVVGVPASIQYARGGAPIVRAIASMRSLAATGKRQPTLAMHRQALRAFQWMVGNSPSWARQLPSPPRREWRVAAQALREEPSSRIWFLADPARRAEFLLGDLALIDRRAWKLVESFLWPFDEDWFIGGARPNELDWYEIVQPGWILGDGWSLTPEAAGVSAARGKGPSTGPIEGWIRRREGPAMLMVGGRNLGQAGGPRARVVVRFDGRPIVSSEVDPAPGFFLQMVPLDPGTLSGAGAFGCLTVEAGALGPGLPVPPVGIEQFDLQNRGQVVFGYDGGWHEPEFNPVTGRMWRWASDRANLRIESGGHDVIVRIQGENPRRYFGRAPSVRVVAGATAVAESRPDGDFTLAFRVPSAVLDAAGGRLTLTTDLTFTPAERSSSPDKRRLGLRIFGVTVEAR